MALFRGSVLGATGEQQNEISCQDQSMVAQMVGKIHRRVAWIGDVVCFWFRRKHNYYQSTYGGIVGS